MDSDKASVEEEASDGSISSILFGFSRQDQIQFEIAVSGILSAATLATAPPSIKGQIIRAAALALPAIAVFHWSVNASRFTNEEFYFGHTYRAIEFLSIIVISHIIHVSVSFGLSELPISIGAIAIHFVGAIALALIGIIFIELIYKAYLLFWGTAFYIYASSAAESVENSDSTLNTIMNYGLYNFSAQLSYLLLKDNIPEGDSQELQDLRNFVSEIEDTLDGEDNLSHSRLLLGIGVIVVPVFIVIAYLLSASVVVIPFPHVLLILGATRITKHMIEVPALIFGTISFPDFLQPNLNSLLTIMFYTTSVYWLFFA